MDGGLVRRNVGRNDWGSLVLLDFRGGGGLMESWEGGGRGRGGLIWTGAARAQRSLPEERASKSETLYSEIRGVPK